MAHFGYGHTNVGNGNTNVGNGTRLGNGSGVPAGGAICVDAGDVEVAVSGGNGVTEGGCGDAVVVMVGVSGGRSVAVGVSLGAGAAVTVSVELGTGSGVAVCVAVGGAPVICGTNEAVAAGPILVSVAAGTEVEMAAAVWLGGLVDCVPAGSEGLVAVGAGVNSLWPPPWLGVTTSDA